MLGGGRRDRKRWRDRGERARELHKTSMQEIPLTGGNYNISLFPQEQTCNTIGGCGTVVLRILEREHDLMRSMGNQRHVADSSSLFIFIRSPLMEPSWGIGASKERRDS